MKIQINQLRRVTALLCCFGGVVAAQPGDGIDEAEIIVSGTRSEQNAVVIPAGITVITAAEIEASGARHIVDVLKSRPSIQVSDLYGDGSDSSINMRGLDAASNTLILVDGRRLNNPDIGGPDLNSISLKDVQRIEIIEGSASVLYGDQAVGGVINIITVEPQELRGQLEWSSGSYGREELRAGFSQAFDSGLFFGLSAETREADNYREHNETDYSNLFLRSGFKYSSGKLFFELQSIDDKLQTPGALLADEVIDDRRQSLPDFSNDFSNSDTDIQRLGIEQSLTEHWRLLAEYTNRKTDGEFVLSFRGFPAAPVSADNPANTQMRELRSVNPRLVADYETANGDLIITAGADLEKSEYELVSALGTQANDQEVSGAYIQIVLPVLPKADLSLGYRQAEVENDLVDRPAFGLGVPDDADLDDDVDVASIGFSVDASEHLRHFIRYEENYRFAKVDEHTASPVVPDFFSGESGEPLKTQTGDSTELGFEWRNDGHHAMLVLYQLNIDDEIIFDPVSFQNINIDSAEHRGATLNSGWRLSEDLQLGIHYSYLDTEITSGTFEGNQVPFTADSVVGLNIGHQIGNDWHIYLEANRTGDRYFAGDLANAVEQLEGYTVANLQLAYSHGPWSLMLRVNNLVDKKYSDYGSIVTLFDPATFLSTDVGSFFPAPERNGWLTLAYRFR